MKVSAYVPQIHGSVTKSNAGQKSLFGGIDAGAFYEAELWPGLEMVRQDLMRNEGMHVGYVDASSVGDVDCVLVSITSARDWWSFLQERLTWKASPTVIAGGAGVSNVRPLMPWVDCFVLGRADGLIHDIVSGLARGEKIEHDSVIWSSTWRGERKRFRQVVEPYRHQVSLSDGSVWQETAIGCQHRCGFCQYSWTRDHVGGSQVDSGALAAGRELCVLDLDLSATDWLPDYPILGIDGFSWRLRRAVGKPITRERMAGLLLSIARHPRPRGVKLYLIGGLPSETELDWDEFLETVEETDSDLPGLATKWGLKLVITPFRAMPATPCALWPMSMTPLRGEISKRFQRHGMARDPNSLACYDGNSFWMVETCGTQSVSAVALDAILLRGDESDSEGISRIARDRRFWVRPAQAKLDILSDEFDLPRIFGAFTFKDLPTAYLDGPYRDHLLPVPGVSA